MDLMQRHNIRNLKGTFMIENEPIVIFDIEKGKPLLIKELNRKKNWSIYPGEFAFHEIGYFELNLYFKNHVVQDGAQDIRGYLDSLGLTIYNIDDILKKTNGYNGINDCWVKFDSFGAQSWEEILALPFK